MSGMDLAGGAIQGAVGMGMGMLQGNVQQHFNQQAQELQIQGLKEMGRFNNELQMDIWNRTNYPAQIKKMQEAGLNVGLMYKSGGEGGRLGNASGNVSGQQNQIDISKGMALMLQNQLTQAQIKLTESQAKNLDAKTSTEDQSRTLLIENLKQVGIKDFQENKLTAWYMSDEEVRKSQDHNETYDYHVGVGENSQYAKQIEAAIFKTVAEKNNLDANALLTNEKAKGYWTELLNETKKADASQIQAKAVKLASEWTTGEYTNWKTWANLAKDAIESVGNIVKMGK